jgi:hypothetical protein
MARRIRHDGAVPRPRDRVPGRRSADPIVIPARVGDLQMPPFASYRATVIAKLACSPGSCALPRTSCPGNAPGHIKPSFLTAPIKQFQTRKLPSCVGDIRSTVISHDPSMRIVRNTISGEFCESLDQYDDRHERAILRRLDNHFSGFEPFWMLSDSSVSSLQWIAQLSLMSSDKRHDIRRRSEDSRQFPFDSRSCPRVLAVRLRDPKRERLNACKKRLYER